MESLGIAAGIPGPVARGDVHSVENNQAALAALGPQQVDFYRTLCARTIPLALEKGSIDEATAERFRQVLGRQD
jgi:predicted short-subunit dehydrogenase-like oxidoreductase (DUF2520 family)